MTPLAACCIVSRQEGHAAILVALPFWKGQHLPALSYNSHRSVDVIKKKPSELALAWLIPAVGAVMFVTIQCFSYLNEYVKSGGTMQAMTFGPAALLAASLIYGAWVVPPLLALAGRRATDWATLVLGGLLVVMSTLGGVSDGLRDGGHLVALQLLAVTLPGAVALVMSWRHIRSN